MSVTLNTFKNNAYVNRAVTLEVNLESFMDEKVVQILKHRGLEHPFLNRYAENGLPPDKSRILYLETNYYFQYLPFYVCGISAITRDEDILRTITFNAGDELGKVRSHSDLYREFLNKKGISDKEIKQYVCLPSTTALNNGIHHLYSNLPIQKALGALFADETMSAAMVVKYNNGLIQEGLTEKERLFWTIHIRVEVGHSNAVFNVIKKYLNTEEDKKLFNEGINQYMYLMERYWDGIANLMETSNA